jgi:hypothetical protein
MPVLDPEERAANGQTRKTTRNLRAAYAAVEEKKSIA